MTQIIDLDKPILVSYESFTALKANDVVSDDGLTLRPTLIELDKISDNASLYKADDFIKSMEDSIWFSRRLKSKCLFGEFEHPSRSSDLERIFHIEPKNYAWNILEATPSRDKSKIMGLVRLSEPLGTQIILPNIKDNGMNIAASVRSITEHYVDKQDPTGRPYKEKLYPIKLITFDAVTLPGFEDCRLMKPDDYVQATRKVPAMESLVNNIAEQVIRLVKSRIRSDESMEILQTIYNIDFTKAKDIQFVQGKRVVFSFENGQSFNMHMDNYLLNELL